MEFLWDGVREAVRLVLGGDEAVYHAVWVTCYCTVSAVALASLVAIPYGAWLALYRPRAWRLQVFLLRLGMFVPTVVVGLIVYGAVSRQGPLSWLDALYTRQAIVAGEFLLAFPILGTFTHAAVRAKRGTPLETALTLGAGRLRAAVTMLGEVRVPVMAGVLAAFARCFSELGVAMPVGGNLAMHTRTLASTAVLEISKGDFGKAVAPGIILLMIAVVLALLAFFVFEREKHR